MRTTVSMCGMYAQSPLVCVYVQIHMCSITVCSRHLYQRYRCSFCARIHILTHTRKYTPIDIHSYKAAVCVYVMLTPNLDIVSFQTHVHEFVLTSCRVYIYIYIYIYIHIYIYICVYIYVCTSLYMYVHVYVSTPYLVTVHSSICALTQI